MASKSATNKPPSHCSVKDLEEIIVEPSGGMCMLPSREMDEVYPGLFVGDEGSSRHFARLKQNGITHVLNSALGKDKWHVNTNREMYQKEGLVFMGVEATDEKGYKISKHFEKSAHFIDEAIKKGGKVLVHCREGSSRSVTLVLVYLMTRCHMTVQEALRLVRAKREVCPNEGFLQQLCDLNEELWREGHYQNTEESN